MNFNDIHLDYDTSKVVENFVDIYIVEYKISIFYGEKAPTNSSSSTQSSSDTKVFEPKAFGGTNKMDEL